MGKIYEWNAMINFEKVVLDEVFYIKFKMPDSVLQDINSEVREMIDNNFKEYEPYNKNLAGAIEHEYNLIKSRDAIDKFFYNCDIKPHGKSLKLAKSGSLWVNFQKKYEYNPLHNHDGVFSFVIWVKIPYEKDEERKCPHVNSTRAVLVPTFSFLYSKSVPNPSFPVDIHHLEIDKSYEGMCVIFPSNLQHMVTPFYTSDDYRISVSGNFELVDAN